ncbi:hypothetical protein EON63_22240 [archaeon]|nr:MAG: hypothetical protein EON63_22240 [archaeon]
MENGRGRHPIHSLNTHGMPYQHAACIQAHYAYPRTSQSTMKMVCMHIEYDPYPTQSHTTVC